MIDFQKMFHVGRLVPDLHRAMDTYSAALGLTWATPFTFEELPLWTPGEGLHTVRLDVTYSREGPMHLEIQIGPKGSFYDSALSSGEHSGFWVDDIAAEVADMQAQGWQVVAAGAAPQDGWGSFVYFVPPDGGMMVEIASSQLKPAFERWWGGADTLG